MPRLAENRTKGVLLLQLGNQVQNGVLVQRIEQEHGITVIPKSLQVMAPCYTRRQTKQSLFAGRCKVRLPVVIANMTTVIDINKKNGILLHDHYVLISSMSLRVLPTAPVALPVTEAVIPLSVANFKVWKVLRLFNIQQGHGEFALCVR
ncbi:hypothetical protein D3C80_1457940 [compost metagenome]